MNIPKGRNKQRNKKMELKYTLDQWIDHPDTLDLKRKH